MYIRVKNISSEAFAVCKTLKLMINFSVNTTYIQPISLTSRPLSENFGNSGRDRKNGFQIRIHPEKVN